MIASDEYAIPGLEPPSPPTATHKEPFQATPLIWPIIPPVEDAAFQVEPFDE